MFTVSTIPVKENVVVRLKNKTSKDIRNNWGIIPGYTFQSKIVFINCIKIVIDHAMLDFSDIFHDTRKNTCYTQLDFELEIVEGEELAEYMIMYNKWLDMVTLRNIKIGVTTGTTPEFFLTDKDGNVTNSIPRFNTVSNKPHRGDAGVLMFGKGLKTVFHSSSNIQCLDTYTLNVMRSLVILKDKLDAQNVMISPKSLIEIPSGLNLTEKEIQVNEPCLNVYGITNIQNNPQTCKYRAASGNITFCIYKTEGVERMIKALDAIVGVACVSLFASFDNPKRREYAGLPGNYKFSKDHFRLEYMVISNALYYHPTIQYLILDLARKALALGDINRLDFWKTTEEETIRCIQNTDVTLAREILSRNKKVFCQIFQGIHHLGEANAETIFNIFMHGIESVVKDPTDIMNNWAIGQNYGYMRYRWNPNYTNINLSGML